jgi:hypothetical protein
MALLLSISGLNESKPVTPLVSNRYSPRKLMCSQASGNKHGDRDNKHGDRDYVSVSFLKNNIPVPMFFIYS